jgi:hypothetical protein
MSSWDEIDTRVVGYRKLKKMLNCQKMIDS